MKRPFVSGVAMLAAVVLATAGCAQATPAAPTRAPEPTRAPAAPTKAAEPAKPAAQPTAQPAAAAPKKTDFPAKGRTISIIVPYAAGGTTDVVARTVAPVMEKELGVPIQVANKPGASTQVGLTEMVRSQPDGYTLVVTGQATTALSYLDPEAKATYGRKDLQPVANLVSLPNVLAVSAESPFKTVKDLVDAAKAKPESIKMATSGLMSVGAFAGYALQEAAGVKFAFVDFEGAAPALTSVLGGHTDATLATPAAVVPQIKSGKVRLLGTFGKEENKFLPGIKTMKAQGYDVYSTSTQGMIARAGTPKEVVDLLSAAAKKALESDDFKKKMDDLATDILYMDPAQYTTYWDEEEVALNRLLSVIRKGKS